MRFVMDRHLGHLARWLRTLGYDAFFRVDASVDLLRAELAKPDTVFVGTDSSAARAVGAQRMIRVPKEDEAAQLRIVCRELPKLPSALMFTRCVICNVPVEPVSKEAVRERLPPAVSAGTGVCTRCPSCGRVYWEGTHTARLRARLDVLLGVSDE